MTDVNKFLERVPDNFNPVAAEMEAFALFYNAKLLNKKASCLMSVVDSKFIKDKWFVRGTLISSNLYPILHTVLNDELKGGIYYNE